MKIRSRMLTKLAAWLAVKLTQTLFRTLRAEIHTSLPETNPYEYDGPERFLYCTWHDSLLIPVFGGKLKHASTLVSKHQDGSYLAEAMQMVGIDSIRGSSKRGGAEAMRKMFNEAKTKHITITPDGPRGPRRKMKAGIVFLASHSGRRIVPIAFGCSRCWRPQGSWTDLVIPKPFSKIVLMSAMPIEIPPNLSRQELNRYTRLVEQQLDQLFEHAQALAEGKEPPTPQAADDIATAA